MKRINKLLAAISKFSSRDYTYRAIHGIKFDLYNQTIEATDGLAAVMVHGTREFVAKMANEYAEYLGLEPVGDSFGIVKLAPAIGKPWPKAERLPEELIHKGNLHVCFRMEHDPEMCNKARIFTDQLPRLNQFCNAVHATLKLIPGESRVSATMQYGTGTYKGEPVRFCIAQMPSNLNCYYESDNPKYTDVSYNSLDEIDHETRKLFKDMNQTR